MEQTNGKKIWGSDMEVQYKTRNEKQYNINELKERNNHEQTQNYPGSHSSRNSGSDDCRMHKGKRKQGSSE
jgi:hypothetical protein